MSEKKTIQINEALFNGTNKTKKNRASGKVKKEKPKPLIKPNKLKKDLLEKIKKHQQDQKIINNDNNINQDTNTTPSDKDKSDFHHDFINSMNYLNKISNKNKSQKNKPHKHKKHKPVTLKPKSLTGSNLQLHSQIKPVHNDPFVSIDLPTDFDNHNTNNNPIIHLSEYTNNSTLQQSSSNYSHPSHKNVINTPSHKSTINPSSHKTQTIPFSENSNVKIEHHEPKYGCLKGGTKPTYRTLNNKTLKNKHTVDIDPTQHTRQQNLDILKKKHKKIKQKSKKTIKSKYNLGRSLKSGKMSILIKNNATRRKIKKEHCLLKQKSLGEIKKYLYDRNLLKFGSTAPNDVIRMLYEQSILAGEINNNSKDVTLHNFISNE